MIKLFVSGFPLDITELELVQLFDPHAPVNTIKIVRDKKTRICKGYAFLEINEQEAAENAVEMLNGQPMGDRVLTVKITEDKPAAPKPTAFNRDRPARPANYVKVEKPSGDFKKKRPRKPL